MSFSTTLPDSLLIVLFTSTGAVGLAGLAAFFLHKAPAALRHWLWLLALIAPLAALPVAMVNIRVKVPVLPAVKVEAVPTATNQPVLVEGPEVVRFPANRATARPTTAKAAPLIWNVWLAIWVLGGAVWLIRLAMAYGRLHRHLQDGVSPTPELQRALEDAKLRLKFRRPVRLRISPTVAVPFCHGVFRPVVVLPESAGQWPEEQVVMGLTHELAHVKRGDLPALLVGQLACGLGWFNPMVWLAARKLREEAERSADDLVLELNISPTSYAANLVALAEEYRTTMLASPAVLTMARPNRLRSRVEAILDATVRRRAPGRGMTLTVGVVAFGLLASALAVQFTTAPSAALPLAKIDLTHLEKRMRPVVWEVVTLAIERGDLRTMESLLNRGLDANVDLVSSTSMLFLAVDDNQPAIAKLLLTKGADVNQKTSWGDTPIKRVCWRGNKEMADILIAAGATANPLQYATGTGDIAALETLEKEKPLTPKQARSLLSFAVASGQVKSFAWLWPKLGPMDEAQKEKLLGDLYEAAGKWGQVSILRHLETLGATPAKYGSRALANAVCWSGPETVKYLLEQGVSPNDSPPGWGNMLRDASGEDKIEIVRLLLEHKANPNIRDSRGLTPLSWAAYSGREDICLLLLEHGADVDIEDDFGENAGWKAAGGMHCPRALEEMIKRGIKLTGRNKNGELLLNRMMRFAPPSLTEVGFPGKIYTEEEIREYEERERRTINQLIATGVNFNGEQGTRTPLMTALETGHHAAAEAIIAHGADVSLKDETSQTALVYIFNYSGRGPLPLSLIERLLKAGADPNVEVRYSTTPPQSFPLIEQAIGYASQADAESFRKAIKLLLAYGATFPTEGNEKTQALLAAAAHGDLPALQREVAEGTSLNATDMNGWNALTIALALGHDDCSDWLIHEGAEVDTQTRQGFYSPLEIAARRGQTALVNTFIAKGARPKYGDGGLYAAISQNNQPLFDSLINSGANVNGGGVCTITSNGVTYRMPENVLLYLCIKNGNATMARTLLEKGADPDPANLQNDRNLVYWAVHYDRPEILQALLAHGANPSLKDTEGVTPLALAQKSHKDLVPILEQATTKPQ